MDKMEVINNFITNSVCLKSESVENDPDKMQLINKVFPHIYIITLAEESNIVRTNYTKCVLQRIGANYTMFYMVRPPAEIYKNYLQFFARTLKSYKLSPSELGALSSHAHILKKICSYSSENTSAQYLILEDDIQIDKQFDTHLRDFIAAHGEFYRTANLVMLSNTTRFYNPVKKNNAQRYYIPSSKIGPIYSCGAYSVTTKYANVLYKQMTKLAEPCDWHFIKYFDTCKSMADGFVFNPPLILQDMTQSTLGDGLISNEIFCRDLANRHPNVKLSDYEYLPLGALKIRDILCVIKKCMTPETTTMTEFVDTFKKYKHNDFLSNILLQFLTLTHWSYSEFKSYMNSLPVFCETEWLPCKREGCAFMAHTNIKNNGGTHCCYGCKIGRGHGPACAQKNI
jgi:GR25 family glycosyltransferase involved in LPS biosynthesis